MTRDSRTITAHGDEPPGATAEPARSVRRRLPIAAILLFSWLVSGAQAAGPRFTIEEAAGCLGLSAEQLEDVRAGKIVSTDYRETSDKELAITVAMLVRRGVHDVAEALRADRVFQLDPAIVKFKNLGDNEPAITDFSDVSFTKNEKSEVDALLNAEPGDRLNLSASEIARFAALKQRFPGSCAYQSPCFEAVVNELRRMLLERLLAYRKGGAEAIAPYDRGHGRTASPAEELRTAGEACSAFETRVPEVHRAITQYPGATLEGLESRFFWMEESVQDRPDFALAHVLLYERPGALVAAQRQIYVMHTYNSLLIMTGCLPLDDQSTLVFYVNRTSTDQVAGFAKKMRHSIGRKAMRSQIVSSFEKIRAQVERAAEAPPPR